MNVPWATRLQFAAVALSVVVYAGLSHYCNTVAPAKPLGVVLAFTPLLLVAGAGLWRGVHPLAAALGAAAAGVLVLRHWEALERHFSWAYLADDCAIYGALTWGFGRTLRRGRRPLCTVLADKVHGPLTEAEVRYTRQVTLAWTIFFAAVALLTVTLFLLAPLRAWSIYANFCTLPLVLTMFAAEYAVRRRRLPQTADGGIVATVRAYFA